MSPSSRAKVEGSREVTFKLSHRIPRLTLGMTAFDSELARRSRRQHLQFSDDARNDFQRAIDAGLVVEPAEGETQTAAGLLVNQTHRAQDVRRLKRSGATGRSSRATNIFLVEHHERRVRSDVIEHDAVVI